MAITTLDGVIAGFTQPRPISKATGTMEAAGILHSLWYAAGSPGPATANAAGVNGRACSASVPGAGHIPRANPGAGLAYVARLAAAAGVPGTLILIDRLWENSGLSVTSTSAQAITPAALPARDINGSSNGDGVEAAIEWSAAGGAGTPLVTLTYTDQDGNAGASGTFTGQATPAAGTFEVFSLASGDTGVRAPTSYIANATRTSGTMHLVLFRRLLEIPCPVAGVSGVADALSGGLPVVPNDACLQLLWVPSATTAMQISGTYRETQG